MKHEKVRRIRLQWKIAMLMALVVLAVIAVLSFASVLLSKNDLMDAAKTKAAGVAKTTAEFVDPVLMTELQEGDEEKEEYVAAVEHLRQFMQDDDIGDIYTMRKDDENLVFVLDADEEEPAGICEEYETYDMIDRAFEGEVTTDDEVTTDEWGSTFSAFAPVHAEDGSIVGIVGVDCSIDALNEKVSDMMKVLLIVSICGLVIATLLAILIGALMSRNIQRVNDKVSELANNEGDLTQTVTVRSGDEVENVAKNVSAFIGQLRTMIRDIREGVDHVYESTVRIYEDVDQTKGELGNVNQTLSTMNESMQRSAKMVGEVTTIATEAGEKADRVQEHAVEQSKKMEELRRNTIQMNESSRESQEKIRTAIEDDRTMLEEQVKKSERIHEILQLTDAIIGISSQTQLLALNASIEAARAGEAGKGFAVVAEEISKLSVETETTAKKISEINSFTVETLDALIQSLSELMEFLDTRILDDFDTMIANNHTVETELMELNQNMSLFSEISGELTESMDQARSDIQRLSDIVEDQKKDILEVSESMNMIVGNMEEICREEDESQSVSKHLEEKISHFKL